MNVQERWEKRIPHHELSKKIYKRLADLDFKNGDVFCFKSGGDGDNGEHLMYLLDMMIDEGQI